MPKPGTASTLRAALGSLDGSGPPMDVELIGRGKFRRAETTVGGGYGLLVVDL